MWTVIAAIIVSGLLGTLTDWLFMGVLFHASYNTHPEIWRSGVREGRAHSGIVWSSVLGLVMSAAVVALCAVAGADNAWSGLGIGFLAWLAGPAPVVVISGLFVKLDSKIVFAHCLGYLARMSIAGAAAGLILPLS